MIITPTLQAAQKTETQPFTMVSGQNDRMAGAVPVWDKFSHFVENIADKQNDKFPDKVNSSFGLSDIIDMVNPLQHIPVVSNLYQSATGDTIGAIAKIVGGALFGGPIGAVASMASVAYNAAKNQTDANPILYQVSVQSADQRAGFTPYNV